MLSLELIKAETGITDEKALKEMRLRIEELSMSVWQVFDKNRTYLSEQDSMVDTKNPAAQNGGRKWEKYNQQKRWQFTADLVLKKSKNLKFQFQSNLATATEQ